MAKTHVTGYAGGSAELVQSTNSTFVKFRLSEPKGYVNRDTNEWVETESTWYDVAVDTRRHQHLAKHVADSLEKGQRVVVSGQYRPTAYIDKNGEAQVGHQIWASDVAASYKHHAQTQVPRPDTEGAGVGVNERGQEREQSGPGQSVPSQQQPQRDVSSQQAQMSNSSGQGMTAGFSPGRDMGHGVTAFEFDPSSFSAGSTGPDLN